jgi:hypothetical protein
MATKTSLRYRYRLVKWWHIWYAKLGLYGRHNRAIAMDSILYDFDDFRPSFTSPLFDSKSSDFCGYYGSCRGFWHILYFMLPSSIYGSLLRFTVPFSDLRFPSPIFGSLFRFSNLPLSPSRPVMPVLQL